MGHKQPQPMPAGSKAPYPISRTPPAKQRAARSPEPFVDVPMACRFVTLACDRYETSAPTVYGHLDDLFRRLEGDATKVSVCELLQVGRLFEEGQWLQANYAANMIYKLRHRLGMDTTGHAGF